MMIVLVLILVAVTAVGVAIFYRTAHRNADRLIISLRLSCGLDHDILTNALEAGRKLELQVRVLTDERDALVNELRILKSNLREYESLLETARREITTTLDNMRVVQRRMRNTAQDEQPGEQNRVPKKGFRAEIEAAGLNVQFHSASWWITEGRLLTPVKVHLDEGNQVRFGSQYECPMRLGTVADAIELAGPPVKEES